MLGPATTAVRWGVVRGFGYTGARARARPVAATGRSDQVRRWAHAAPAMGHTIVSDISYLDAPECLLDVHKPPGALLPSTDTGLPVLVWLYGGSLLGGSKTGDVAKGVAKWFAESGSAIVVAVDYRVSPKNKWPTYVQDAAAAVAWTFQHIAQHGGDTTKIFVGGHSAGAYLSMLLALDKQWLGAQGLEPSELAGLLPISGQTVTHQTVCVERGMPGSSIRPADTNRPGKPGAPGASMVVDECAPLFWAGAAADSGIRPPPMLLVAGTRDKHTRLEENMMMVGALARSFGEPLREPSGCKLVVVEGATHSSVVAMENDAGESTETALAMQQFIAEVEAGEMQWLEPAVATASL